MRATAATGAALLVVLAWTGAAAGAQLVDRNAAAVRLATNANGEALLTYRTSARVRHVLVWGAINAAPPRRALHQVKFQLDYAGGYGKYHTAYWKRFGGACAPYDGPTLPNVVAACKAADGSYWAVQSWRQPLPDLGFVPWTPELRASWLEVSHWTGAPAQLSVGTNWVYSGRFQNVFGRLVYGGEPVYGFGTTHTGAPTDNFGRLVYVDTLGSRYGAGWRRENSFVTHNPTGVFCYGFFRFDPARLGYRHPAGATARRGPGTGSEYRITASGPGVTPNVSVVVPGLHPFDPRNPGDVAYQRAQTARLRSWGDRLCRAGLG